VNILITIFISLALAFAYHKNPLILYVIINVAGFILIGAFCGFLMGFALDNFSNGNSYPLLASDGSLTYSGPIWAVVWEELPANLRDIAPLIIGAASGLFVFLRYGKNQQQG
jgi:hypothetical protein